MTGWLIILTGERYETNYPIKPATEEVLLIALLEYAIFVSSNLA
jgi:hypothetical protein